MKKGNCGFNLASKPSGDGCVECMASPKGWQFHLRRCVECGHIGCCNSSPSQNASKHAAATEHPIITSFEPGEAGSSTMSDVRQSYSPALSVIYKTLHRSPGIEQTHGTVIKNIAVLISGILFIPPMERERSMDEIKIQIVEPESVQTPIKAGSTRSGDDWYSTILWSLRPALGFGTLISDAAETIRATRDALEVVFRHFDCAERNYD